MKTFKLNKIYFFFILTTLLLSFCFSPIIGFAQSNKPIDVSVSPSYIDLGNIENKEYSFDAKVTNNTAPSSFNVNIEGKGNEFISVTPKTFELKQGESKSIKIKLNNVEKIPIGPYDLSISFMINNSSGSWVSSTSSSAIRLKFNKPGITIASMNVFDVEKSSTANFNTIFANFTNKNETIDVVATITDKKTDTVVSEFKETISMNPYPSNGFYGTMKMPWVADFEMGDYLFKVDSITSDGTTIHGEKSFVVGLIKGELLNVEVKNVHKGTPAKIIAQVKNIGNLKLPTTFDIVIKDNLGKDVFKSNKKLNISPQKEDTIIIDWPTDNVKTGDYTVEYTVAMGNDLISDTMNFKVLNPYIVYIILCIVFIVISLISYIIFKRKKLQNNN